MKSSHTVHLLAIFWQSLSFVFTMESNCGTKIKPYSLTNQLPYNYIRVTNCTPLFQGNAIQKIAEQAKRHYPSAYFNNGSYWPYVMFPASLWLEEERLYLTVLRLRFTDEQYTTHSPVSLLYITTHDEQWNEREKPYKIGRRFTTPQILNIKFSLKLGEHKFDGVGPQDPRLYRNENGDICVAFNMITWVAKAKRPVRKMHVYNLVTRTTRVLTSAYIPAESKQKNWAPIIIGNHSYFMIDTRKAKLVKCSRSTCTPVKNRYKKYVEHSSAVRGGTPFIKVMNDFYLAMLFIHAPKMIYSPMMALLHVKDDYPKSARIIALTDALEFKHSHKQGWLKVSIPASIARINVEEDWMEVTVYFEDQFNYVYNVTGVKRFIQESIRNPSVGHFPIPDFIYWD